MRTLKIFAALVTLAMGCGTYDPCAGQSGTCVGLIADNLSAGDVIHVTMIGAASTEFTQTLQGSAPFGIPVLVKSDASGQATITVEKMVGASTMARGVTDVSFASGGHTLAMVDVKPIVGSNVGNPDMSKPPVCVTSAPKARCGFDGGTTFMCYFNAVIVTDFEGAKGTPTCVLRCLEIENDPSSSVFRFAPAFATSTGSFDGMEEYGSHFSCTR